MKKIYEKPSLELTVFQSYEETTQSVVAQAEFGYFEDAMRRGME